MGRPASKATAAEVSEAFHTEEGFKATATRLGMSPNTLRKRWKAEFGEAAFKERGKTLQAKAAAATARDIAHRRVYKDVEVVCTSCGASVQVKSNQAAQMDLEAFQCDSCKYDRECPVCGQGVIGEKGLSGHFRHRREAGDQAHIDHLEGRWDGLVEGRDFVVCRECGVKAKSLVMHLVHEHGLTAEVYRSRHAGARVRSEELSARRSALAVEGHVGRDYTGTKEAPCPDCGEAQEVSKYAVPGYHHLWCPACRDLRESKVWKGLVEPEDYVTCRLCQFRAINLTSHMQSSHPGVQVDGYKVQFPGAQMVSLASGQRDASVNKLNLTKADLEPYGDEKGRIIVSWAAEGLECSGQSVLRYCKELGFKTRNRLATQRRVLDLLAEILDEDYEWEWSHPLVRNPETDWLLFFDGYFPELGLVVEYHGKQHYEYVPYWHKTEAAFERRQWLDGWKAERARVLGLTYMEIKYDEPFEDESYLRGRLVQLGC